MTGHEILATDFVYGWWAVLTQDGSALTICRMRRQRWNFLFHLDSRDSQDPPGPHSWVMQPSEKDSLVGLHALIESAIDDIFAEQQSRRQVFVEVQAVGPEAANRGLSTLQAMGFPVAMAKRPA